MITMLGVLRHSSDGAKVTFDQAFRAPAAELWDAVTNPDRLERWFARVDGDLVERGHFTIHLDGDDVPLCHLIECSPGRQFAFEWPMQQQTLVTVKVLPDGKHSRLELHHERLVPTSAPRYGPITPSRDRMGGQPDRRTR